MSKNKQNRLGQEASLYLRQHADNPVDWYPWGAEALNKAKQENKPILLSIGYSACHWCHVMAHDAFSDPKVAKIMNEYFINIKVDREERPDLDKIYQLTHQILTGRGGGWPLNVFLSPDNQMPFFAGTYFPPEPRYGMPSFKELLLKLAEIFRANPVAIAEQSTQLTAALQQYMTTQVASNEKLNTQPLAVARAELLAHFDPINGGFGDAPKFPHPTNLERLWRDYLRSKEQGKEGQDALTAAKTSLTKMAQGGIYDQLGGGFFRYSVDARWEIPHFEKMLYDNAQLLALYAEVNLTLKDTLFNQIIRETAEWALREMRSPEGGFYATLDADSEHVEGKFYYWDRNYIKNLLSAEEYQAVEAYFGLEQAANFEGHWHLHVIQNSDGPHLQSARKKLWHAREQRIRPGRDEKILTAWNALMIKGLAMAGQALKRQDFIEIAEQTVDFIHSKLWINNRLYVYYQNGSAHLMAYLDDYAFLLDALLVLYKLRQRKEDLQFAIALADILLNYFMDEKEGGFFFTASDHEALILRPKPLMDEAVPAGNGVAARALARLGHLLSEERYLKASEKTLNMAWPAITAYPSAHNSLLNALEEYLYPA